jgi:quercetin dioxygenase-like cupin family protein
MKVCALVSVLSLVGSFASTAYAQDPTKVDAAHYKVVLDNPSVRVLHITYAPGEKSKMHKHPDALVVMLGTAKMKFTMAGGKTEEHDMAMGTGLYTPAMEHSPENVGTTPMDGILVEFKAPAAGTATLPTSRPGLTTKVIAEGPRAMAYATTADPTFAEPAGSKHDYDQVVIATMPGTMSLMIDGKPAKTTWAKGDAVFIPRGVGHEAKNTSGKPQDMVIVAIK